jgi:hypothetical protein
MRDQLDEWVRSGLFNGGELSAADCQIAPSVALLVTMEDLGPLLHGRPSLRLAERLVPQYPAHLPPGTLFVPSARAEDRRNLELAHHVRTNRGNRKF